MVIVVSPALAAEPVPVPRPKYESVPLAINVPPGPTCTDIEEPAVIPAWNMAA
jgi:hypothetical protein